MTLTDATGRLVGAPNRRLWRPQRIVIVDPQGYTDILATTEHGGYPLQQHLSNILGGDLIRAAGLDGALVASKRGGDFLLDLGQDFAIGYTSHNAEQVTLYLEESFSFRVAEPWSSCRPHKG